MNIDERLNDINEIKSMMEKSSKFLSLSGLSGVISGVIALLGSLVVYLKYEAVYKVRYGFDHSYLPSSYQFSDLREFVIFSFFTGIIVLILALVFGFYFTYRKSLKKGYRLSGAVTQRLLESLSIPLVSGGVLIIILAYHHLFYLIAPLTLIFYGLALVNASKFTLGDIKYLGILEIILGLISSIFIGYAIVFWAIGFGLLHIIYGITMYMKYDR